MTGSEMENDITEYLLATTTSICWYGIALELVIQ